MADNGDTTKTASDQAAAGTASTDQDKSAQIDEGVVMMLEYENKLMEEMGFDKLPPEERRITEEKLGNLINNRIINLMMVCVQDEHIEPLKEILKKGDDQELAKFMQEKVPGWSDRVVSELMQLREDLLGK